MATAKFDIKSPLYVGVGATDLAVEYVRETVADVQKRLAGVQQDVKDFDFRPLALRTQAEEAAKARRAKVEARVADRAERVQSLVNENVATVTDTYADLAKRGESLVTRIRRQEATKQTVASAQTTVSKAKATKTQATAGAKKTAKKASTAAKSTAKEQATTAKKDTAAARSSAKGAGTAAKKTATAATKAVIDATAKVGD